MRQQLEQTLNELHEQLVEVQDLKPHERDRLQLAVKEIQDSLDRSEISSLSLAERLSQATQDFNDSHPALANSVGRIADMLAQMGI